MAVAFDPIEHPSETLRRELSRELQRSPEGRGLGRVGTIAEWTASVQNRTRPVAFRQPQCVLVAGNHGVAARDISAQPHDAAWTTVKQIAAGGGVARVAAEAAGASIIQINDYLTLPTGAIDRQAAMTPEAFEQAVAHGARVVDQGVDSGVDLFIPGDIGVGNSTVAAAVYGALSRTEPVKVIGRGSGIDDNVWKVKVAAIRDAMFRVRTFSDDVPRVLAELSGPDFAFLVGMFAQAAVRRTPVLFDGLYATVAAYAAERLAPGTKQWIMAGQLSPEPAQMLALQALDIIPVLALDLSLNRGVGALAALPQINLASELVTTVLGPEAPEGAPA